MDATVGALAASLGGEVIGDLDRAIANALALSKAGPDCVTFLADEVKIQEVSDVSAATIIVSRSRQEELTDELRGKHTFIVVDDALDGFIEAARQFRSDRPRSAIGISPGSDAVAAPTPPSLRRESPYVAEAYDRGLGHRPDGRYRERAVPSHW